VAVRFLAYDWITRDPRTPVEVPFTQFKFGETISRPGGFDASLSPQVAASARNVLDPARTLVYVEENGQLVWGGTIWSTEWANNTLRVGGGSLWSYLDRILIRGTRTYTAQDPFDIVADLLAYAQGKSQADLGLTLRRHPATTGLSRDRTFQGNERKQVSDAIEQLGEADFEFTVGVEWSASTPREPEHYLDVWHPTAGRVTDYVWASIGAQAPIRVESFTLSGDQMNTVVDAIGSGTGAGKQIGTATFPITTYPRLEGTRSYTDIASLGLLNAQAQAELNRTIIPPQTVKVELTESGRERFPLGSWIVGDSVVISAHDGPGLDVDGTYRIQSWEAELLGSARRLKVSITLARGGSAGRPMLTGAQRLRSERSELIRRVKRLEEA
jgi:hypothetical protein